MERFGGELPARLDDLVTLPGIGRKTANVILGNAFDIPGITVDTHFGRLVRRWGWTEEEDPVKVEHAVGELVPKRDWTMVSHYVIFHGRRVCHARKPACGACSLAVDCPSFGLGPTDPVEAAALVKGPERPICWSWSGSATPPPGTGGEPRLQPERPAAEIGATLAVVVLVVLGVVALWPDAGPGPPAVRTPRRPRSRTATRPPPTRRHWPRPAPRPRWSRARPPARGRPPDRWPG